MKVSNKYDTIIAIDPDTVKSGVAVFNVPTMKIAVQATAFPQLVDYLITVSRTKEAQEGKTAVVVEAGWLNAKSCFHEAQGHRAERVAKNVGANHETGRKILEMARHYGLPAFEIAPLRKCWKGANGKITAEELKQVTGVDGRTNQDERDAVLLAWVYAGFPIRIKV